MAGPRSSTSPIAAARRASPGRRLFAEIESEWAEELGADLIAGLREGAERVLEHEGAAVPGRSPAASAA